MRRKRARWRIAHARETSNLPPKPATAVVCNHVQTSGRPLTMVVIVNARRDDIPLCLRYPSHERQITVNTNAIARFALVGFAPVCTRCPKSIVPRILSVNTREIYNGKQDDNVDRFNNDSRTKSLCYWIQSRTCERIINNLLLFIQLYKLFAVIEFLFRKLFILNYLIYTKV